MQDRRISEHFWLHEWPCWWLATEAEYGRLEETTHRVLEPFRAHIQRWAPPGAEIPVIPTSWTRWSSGCRRREGSHRHGGTADFDAPQLTDAQMREAFDWGVGEFIDRGGYLGRWILEPRMEDAEGNKIQGRHLHAAPVDDMVAAYGLDDRGAYIETSPGQYDPVEGGSGWGAYGDPIPLPPFVVAIPGGGWGRWLALGLLGAVAADTVRRRRS